jgi:hypothetical protein
MSEFSFIEFRAKDLAEGTKFLAFISTASPLGPVQCSSQSAVAVAYAETVSAIFKRHPCCHGLPLRVAFIQERCVHQATA